ncbi:hypothetical protein WJX75_004088 [Coccomyxa subellipsoidea]|uniref:Uncharacterized protein n=1 Tax=Coccomyxa subellipsoidea TaxID=248742 RepID=A0ABR2YJC4_9CHLO
MTGAELKVILLAVYTLLFIGTLALAALITVKNMLRTDSKWLGNNIFSKVSIGLATPCLTLLVGVLIWGLWRIWGAWRSGKHWGERRRRLVILAFSQVLFQAGPSYHRAT